MHDDGRPSSAATTPDGQGELVPPPHPVTGRQHASRGSDRDAGAALAAPRGDDRSPGAGAHPQPEAVLLVATTVVRLESTLAHSRLQCCGRLSSGLGLQVRCLASRAASGPPQRGPTRARPARTGRTRAGNEGDEMAGTRHLRRCDSTSERYGLPGHVVKRSRYLRRSFDDRSGPGERLLSTRATRLRRRDARNVAISEGVWGWPRIREAGEEHVASLRGRALMSPWRADRRHCVRCGRVPFPLLPGRRVFAPRWPILSPTVADGVPPTFAQGFDAHTQRVDNSVDNS
jgi:hypothetical protein